jgi:C1A family cysteine protease
MVKEIGMPTTLTTPGEMQAIPTKVDLRKWCSPIENQMQLGSCTANAAVGVVEYFENRAFNRHIDGSRLFIYKATRNLMGVVGDTGAWLRTTMGALVLCGCPPERYWTYTDRKQPGPSGERTFDAEPPSFVYSIAENYEAIRYFSHDPIGMTVPKPEVLASVKRYLAAGIPSMFGFYGFSSFGNSSVKGDIPYPCPGERAIWGHAIVAVGYDDAKVIENTLCHQKTTGALLIRNSWGTGWGDQGYGWLPYSYILNGLALDFWSLLRMEWVATGQFGL